MSALAWFPLFVDDFLGGTSALLPAELGAYLAALLAQWQSAELKAIPDDRARLVRICGGTDFTKPVRNKFVQVEIDQQPYLRNKRLAAIWDKQFAEHEAKVRGGKARARQLAEVPAERPALLPAELPASRARAEKNPEPRTQNSQLRKESPEPLFAAFAQACCFDPAILDERMAVEVNSSISLLQAMEKTLSADALAVQVVECGKWHVTKHWVDHYPKPKDIPRLWKQFKEAKNGSGRNGTKVGAAHPSLDREEYDWREDLSSKIELSIKQCGREKLNEPIINLRALRASLAEISEADAQHRFREIIEMAAGTEEA